MPGKIIKPGQEFYAYEHEIPQGFRDVIIPLEEIVEDDEKPVVAAKPEYFLKSRGQGGWYNVVDSNGKVMNEKALKKEAADEFIEELMA